MSKLATPLRATRISAILIGVLVMLICVLIGGSLFAATQLYKLSTAATRAQIDAEVSASDPSRLEALKDYLATNATGISQTASLTEGLGQYDQNSIVAAITNYANRAGVSVTSFDFGGGAVAGTPAASGDTVTLTLGSPLKYQNFIVFLRLLEQGLMPATITNAQVSANPENPSEVNVSSFGVKVIQ